MISAIRLMARAVRGWGRIAGSAVGERAAVGERDRVVGGIDVGDRALVAARAAARVAGVERRLELGPGQRLEQVRAPARERDAERVEPEADPPDARDRVDVARVAEVVEPADQLGGVGTEEGEVEQAVVERADRLAEGALGEVVVRRRAQVGGVLGAAAAVGRAGADRGVGELGLKPGELDQVVVAARAADDRVEVADRSAPRPTPPRAARQGTGAAAAPPGGPRSTSGSTSSSAARRLTKVVLAVRRKSGSSAIDSASRSRRSPIAFIIRFRFPTRAEMSGARAASAPESCELSTIRFSSAA